MKWPTRLEEIKPKTWILALVLIGLILRFYSSIYNLQTQYNTYLDEVWYLLIAIGTISSPWQRLSTLYHGPVFFYLTDIGYKLFGTTYFGARFFPVIFSTISIVLVYLLAKEFYGKKTALISAAVFTFFSPQIIFGSLGLFEPIYTALILLSMFLFVRWMKDGDYRKILASAAFFGVAAATKIIVFYYLPPFVVYYLLSDRKTKVRELVAPALVLILFLSPVILYNYFLYNDKQLADFHVARYLNLPVALNNFQSYYLIVNQSVHFSDLGDFVSRISFLMTPISLFLLIIGIFTAASFRNRKEDAFLLIWLLVPTILYATYIFHDYYLVVLAPPSAILLSVGIKRIADRFDETNKHKVLALIIFVFVAFELFSVAKITADKTSYYKLQEFAVNIPKNTIILSDPKISNFLAYWVFNGVLGSSIQNFGKAQVVHKKLFNVSDDLKAYLYYVTCEVENCGWDKENNARAERPSEEYAKMVRSDGKVISEIYENGVLVYRIYMVGSAFGSTDGVITFAHQILPYLIYPPFLGYRIGKPELSDDVYSLHGPIDKILDLIGHAALYTDILLALSAPVLAFYLFLKEEDAASP